MMHFHRCVLLSLLWGVPCPAQMCGTPKWSHVTDQGPGPRRSVAIAFDQVRGKTVIYGGGCSGPECVPGTSFMEDTWEWDGQEWQFKAAQGPIPKRGTQACFDPAGERIIIFGGYNNMVGQPQGTFYDETWAWTGQAWVLLATTGPSPRNACALAADTSRERVVLFGGYNSNIYVEYGDTWEWTGAEWLLQATTGPVKRVGHAMAYDKVRARTVLFGGSAAGHTNDTWEWDGSAWTQMLPSGPLPLPRRDHSMAFDSTRGRVLMFGGWVGQLQSTPGDLWEWDGASWQQLATPGPSPRMAGIAFDTWRGRLVLYGGFYLTCCSFQTLGDTWEFAWPIAPSVYENPLPLSVNSGAPAHFSAASLGAPPLSWQWRHEGVPLVNGGGISGATTSQLVIDGASSANAGVYDVAVTNACSSTLSAPATLTVACYADCNADGSLTVADFGCFQTKFVAMDPYADCNQDNAFTVTDFGCFQTEFVTGCK